MRIDFSPPDITESEIQAVADALRSGWITTGPRVGQFEQELASWCGTARVGCLNSATAALECALHLLGIGPDDEVITSAYTYTASASVICHVGATPVLVDTAPGSYEMDYEALANAITARTKAVIPVDIAGVMCDYDSLFDVLRSVASRFEPAPGTLQQSFDRVIVLADGAHSFGASYQGRPSGSVADFTTFSFHAVKNLTTAEGGAITWRAREGLDDDALYREVKLFSLHGQDKDALSKTKAGAWEYDVIAPLYKCNMTDVAAALGLMQLKRYPELLARRREILERYGLGLAPGASAPGASVSGGSASGVGSRAPGDLAPGDIDLLQHYTERGVSSGHLCLVRFVGRGESFRNHFIECMAERGVACNVHYKPLPLLTAYKNLGFDIKDFPNAFRQYENEATLPLHTRLTNDEVDYVIDSFKESYRKCVRAGV
jgi:dTDP-4-amino-4,6-dideoxygalactose transaminase